MKRIATTTIVAIMLVSLMAGAIAEDRTVELDLQFVDLEPLASGHYEGWLIIDGQPVSTGKFNIDANGDLVDLDGKAIDTFRVKNVDLEMATMFVLSIEPEGDTDEIPAAVKPLAGALDVDKESADLAANIGVDLTGISGTYILATPSNNFAPDDYDLELDFDGLPMLSSGHYEGWLIVDGTPVSTGKFNIDANGDIVDLDGNMIDAFTLMDLDIDDVEMFVLSIEEEGDDDTVPGAIKPLAGAVDGTGLTGSIAHTIGVDLSGADGVYILATPSNNDDYYLDLT
ncbi:MAG: anti-sigma factor, partial [Thermoplasmata archaeon]